jgi:hypothetical protein
VRVLAALIVMAMVVGSAVSYVWLLLRRRRLARLARRSPLTTALLRAPGHTLRQQLEASRFELGFDVMALMAIPALGVTLLYLMDLVRGATLPIAIFAIVLVAVGAFCVY